MTSADTASPEGLVRCVSCGLWKPGDAFSWKFREQGQRRSCCKPCQAAYAREHYRAHRSAYIARAAERRRATTTERLTWLFDYFATHPCVDCGQTNPNVLDFDHRRDKSFNIARDFRHRPWGEILDEIAKCEVRCGNCHRRRTNAVKGWYRAECVSDAAAPAAGETA